MPLSLHDLLNLQHLRAKLRRGAGPNDPVVYDDADAPPLPPLAACSMVGLHRGVDTLIRTGCSTSGCVRATAVDGMQHGLRVVVPFECVGDRLADPHEASLFDIHSKYGDVLPKSVVVKYLATQEGGRS